MQSDQHPIPSGFGAKTTAAEVIGERDLTGTVAIVTGGGAGLGRETTRVLAQAGATVVVPARSLERVRASLAGIPRVEIVPMDLLDPASIDAFAAQFLASGRALDLLITNAGIMATPLTRDARGYETQFAANHLGHFQLAARLWPALKAAGGARVVTLSSRGHMRGAVDFDDPNFLVRPYDKWAAYGQSKTADVLFAVELDKRAAAHGVRAFAVHPGGIFTDLGQHLTDDEMRAMGVIIVAPGQRVAPADDDFFKNVEQGAATTVWAATSSQLDGIGGVYCEDVDVSAIVQPAPKTTHGVYPWAIDPEFATRLWGLSEQLTGVPFVI